MLVCRGQGTRRWQGMTPARARANHLPSLKSDPRPAPPSKFLSNRPAVVAFSLCCCKRPQMQGLSKAQIQQSPLRSRSLARTQTSVSTGPCQRSLERSFIFQGPSSAPTATTLPPSVSLFYSDTCLHFPLSQTLVTICGSLWITKVLHTSRSII